MRPGEPAVSVIMPTFNRADIISRSIKSVLRQSLPDFELIVIDDVSTDDTEAKVRAFEDPRIRYIRRAVNHLKLYRETGEEDNPRNDGLKIARGRYISYLDSDDMYRVDFLREMTAFLDAHPEVGLAYANAIWHRNLTGKKEEADCNLAVDFGPKLMRIRNIIRTPTVMHRREVVEKVGYFKPVKVRVPHADASYVGIEDWDYWLRVSEHFEVRQHPVILAHKINETSDHYLDPDFDPEFEAAPEPAPETESRDLFYRMGIAADFKAREAALAGVEGHLNPAEGYALMLLAAHGAGAGEIVEIGSFMGLSTCWLALGAKSAGREAVTAVDHFKGSKEHQAGRRHECAVLVEAGTTYPRFLENIERVGVGDQVRPVKATSEEAAGTWDRPIRLLFIDGDHRYESTRQDFELWSRFVVEGGYIAFHDVGTWPGVTRFYGELMERGGYQEVWAALALRIVRKIGREP